MEYILYCDESAHDGPKYGDFFGGCLINSKDLHPVVDALQQKKDELNLKGEIKWTKVTANYLNHYIQMMDLFFDLIRDGKIKVRVMFRATEDRIAEDAHKRDEDRYFKLYYQFLKHAFGLKDIPTNGKDVFIRIYMDQLPDTKEKCDKFKEYVRNIPYIKDFQSDPKHIHIREEDVADICSHDHILLQCTDIVLGAMYFRLNDLHKIKPDGARIRGKRTIAKEKLYKHINRRIRELLPHFNIGISTGQRNSQHASWEHPYAHWKFVASKK